MVPSSTAVIVHQQLYGDWVSSDHAPSHLLPSTRPRDLPQNTFTPTDKTTLSPSTALQQKHRRAPKAKGWSPTQLAPGELCPHQRRRYSISVDAEDCSTDDVTGGDYRRVPRVKHNIQNNSSDSETSSKGGLPRVRLFKIRREWSDDFREALTKQTQSSAESFIPIHFNSSISAARV